MRTVILKWNPSISSFSMLAFLHGIFRNNHADSFDMNWSVWDYEEIKEGDRVFFLKVGDYGQCGIVAAGFALSKPYRSEDWSGKGRTTYYIDLEFDTMLNPDAVPILTSEQLSKAIPDFDWTGGHSGVVLTEAQAVQLEQHWDDFLSTHCDTLKRACTLNRGDKDLVFIKEDFA